MNRVLQLGYRTYVCRGGNKRMEKEMLCELNRLNKESIRIAFDKLINLFENQRENAENLYNFPGFQESTA